MDTQTIFNLTFPTITIILAVFLMFQNLNKKIDSTRDTLENRISNLEVTTKLGFQKLDIEIGILKEKVKVIEKDHKSLAEKV